MITSYSNHWLYKIIPVHRDSLKIWQPWKWVTWALLGNDDDGIFGEGPKSGSKWISKWGGTVNKADNIFKPGTISFERFLGWQIRNPLHNFTFYVIGVAWAKNIPLRQLALITTKHVSFYRKLQKANIFPMQNDSGIYFGLHMLPCISYRLNLGNWKRIEGYCGWRTRGNFGLALRMKSLSKQITS